MYTVVRHKSLNILNIYIMSCNNFGNINSCGKCKFNILSTNLMKILTINQVVKIGAILLSNVEFTNGQVNTNSIDNINIYCNRQLELDIVGKYKYIKYKEIKDVYILLLRKWYKVHSYNKHKSSNKLLKQSIEQIQLISNSTKLRNSSILLVKYIQDLTICNGNCTTITLDKEIVNCEFQLSNMTRYCDLDCSSAINIIDSIINVFNNISRTNIFIDTTKVIVKCNGLIYLNDSYIECNNNISYIKQFYSSYLHTWCIYNTNSSTDIDKIMHSLRAIRTQESINGIHNICDSLWKSI